MSKPLPPFTNLANSFRIGEYQHYKGNRYRVLAIAWNSTTDALVEMVVYQGLYEGNPVFVQPLKDFVIDVEVAGEKQPRFKFLGL